ncbi:MAG: uracil phosphoribosyltransferase [Eubacteriaceae bacterium]|jgi:uracil phosphoribosyltransferase
MTDTVNDVHILDHPLAKHKLTQMRNKNTPRNTFRALTNELATMLAYEVTRDFETVDVEVETPLQKTMQPELKEKKLAVVPILRAGLGMVDGFSYMLPNAIVSHIGLYRDPRTKKPIEYYQKFPKDMNEREVIIVDPMLATGGSAIEAIRIIKGVTDKQIYLVNILDAPEGVKAVHEAYPDVKLYTVEVDEKLNDNAYILPGLGDAGDRLFGTE